MEYAAIIHYKHTHKHIKGVETTACSSLIVEWNKY